MLPADFRLPPDFGILHSALHYVFQSFSFEDFSFTQTPLKFISGGTNTYPVTATAGAGGSISPAGTVNVSTGTSQTFNITPNADYAISQVTDNDVNQDALGSYTVTNVQTNHTIAASFVGTNASPTIFVVANQNLIPNTSTTALDFTVDDADTSIVNLTVNRTVTITPAANQTGTTTITITVSDGSLAATSSFTVTVAAGTGTSKAISVNLGYTGSAIQAVTGNTGANPRINWNNINTSGINLIDDSGTATGTSITVTGWTTSSFSDYGTQSKNLYSSFLFHDNGGSGTMANATINLT